MNLNTKLFRKCIVSLSLMVAVVIATMGLSINVFADDSYAVPTENSVNWTIDCQYKCNTVTRKIF